MDNLIKYLEIMVWGSLVGHFLHYNKAVAIFCLVMACIVLKRNFIDG